MGKLNLKDCLHKCESIGSGIFEIGSETSDACEGEGSCDCVCYNSEARLNSCQLQQRESSDLYRIVDIDEKV